MRIFPRYKCCSLCASISFPVFYFFLSFIFQLMSQLRWFKKLNTVLLIIIANYFDFVLNRRACCAHFYISDDLDKSNEQLTHCIDNCRQYYDVKNAQSNRPPNKHLFCATDNCGGQCKNMYQFAWMADYVEEDHGLETIQHNFSAEQHGKGNHDAEGGAAKTLGELASTHGYVIDTAYDLYHYLKTYHSTPTHTYHEALHQIDSRCFHYMPRGTFLSYHPREPKALSSIKPFYCWSVRRTGNNEEKTIYKRKHFCPCPSCTVGDFVHCLHQQFMGEWYAEQMTVKYVTEDIPATLRADHAVDIQNCLHVLLETFTGYFFVAIFTNAEVQRPTFGYISAQSRFHDVRVRMHVLDPFVPIGKEHLLNYFNHAMFKMPRKLCFKPVCNCDAHHTRLVEYSKILMPCVGKTPSDKLVHSVFEDFQLSTQDFGVFKFKESYEDAQLTRYKTLRLKLWAPYTS